ncbi:hypothetical protein TELCIR_04018 [Teladorsagia circumcincta]|uniref:Uncharacterized protein n=1 Tax=Teladorsagia circumcincta TaxID=45464 RepID=A0A2G9UW77_TELCI|nr:hypothetical protein TELCIR_04018 [Teladorsagia circumcincta]
MQPAEELQSSGGLINRPYIPCDDDCALDHEHVGSAAKGKLNSAGQAIMETAQSIGDKAVELKDKAKDMIQDGVDAIMGN